MTSDNRTCLKILLGLALVLWAMWVWDARAEFDPYCWEFNPAIHKICYTGGFYGVCYR